MVDHLSPAARSKNMSRVRSRDTGPELRVRRALHRAGFRFRLHRRDIPGTPDVYLPKYRLAVFVHGCFWHGHEGCRRAKLPATRQKFWREKIERNKARDRGVEAALSDLGIVPVILWECGLKDEGAIVDIISRHAHRASADDDRTE